MKPYDYVKTRPEAVAPIAEPARFRRNMKLYTKLNVWAYKLSGGQLMNTAMGGYPICLVAITGRKTGKRREVPLIHVPYGDCKILVGSQGGLDRDPVWVHSVRANPTVSIVADGRPRDFTARQVSDAEKAELWPHLCRVYPAYDEYQARTDRNIPVFLCEPAESAGE